MYLGMENNLGSNDLKFKWKRNIVDTWFILQVYLINILQGRKKSIFLITGWYYFYLTVKSNNLAWVRKKHFVLSKKETLPTI